MSGARDWVVDSSSEEHEPSAVGWQRTGALGERRQASQQRRVGGVRVGAAAGSGQH
jgi:hypothetical protein